MARQNAVLPTGAYAVTPSDTAQNIFTALYIGTAGDVNILPDDQAISSTSYVLFKNVPAGTTLPIAGKKVLSTSTTASNIVAYR